MGVSYADTIERMRWAGKLKNDSAVARVLGVTPQALSNYKKRGEMPTDLVLRFANIYGLSVDWLITGKGNVYRFGVKPEETEREGYVIAAEEAASYGRDNHSSRCLDFGVLTPDEIIYVGKLLKVLRNPNKERALAIKCTVDAFVRNMDKNESCSESAESE